jgi:two-component system nitrogen regulation response regulator NtrX
MDPGTQAKILRAVESGAVERLGGSRPIAVDARIISATNQELQAAIRESRFREDLYFRLAGVTLYLPPLRQRREDIPLLIERFWSSQQRKYEKNGPELGREALAELEGAAWPGNVRQLRNVMERLFVMAGEAKVTAGDVVAALGPGSPNAAASLDGPLGAADLREGRRLFEIEYLTRKLREHGGNVTRTAKEIGIERQSLQEKIKKLGIVRI